MHISHWCSANFGNVAIWTGYANNTGAIIEAHDDKQGWQMARVVASLCMLKATYNGWAVTNTISRLAQSNKLSSWRPMEQRVALWQAWFLCSWCPAWPAHVAFMYLYSSWDLPVGRLQGIHSPRLKIRICIYIYIYIHICIYICYMCFGKQVLLMVGASGTPILAGVPGIPTHSTICL